MTTPAPTPGVPGAVEVVVLGVLGVPPLVAAAVGSPGVAAVLGVPAALVIGYWLFGRVLLLAALVSLRPRGIVGVLVTSRSPTWQPHIEREWLPAIGGSVVTLNWSERATWGNALPVLLWRHFCGTYGRTVRTFRKVNPAVIVLRGLRDPLVFRFYGPFELAKHGDVANLKALERELMGALAAVIQPSSPGT